jgi:hypothetical protein
MKVTSTEFQQNVGRYQDAALRAPVTITKNGATTPCWWPPISSPRS